MELAGLQAGTGFLYRTSINVTPYLAIGDKADLGPRLLRIDS